MAEAVPSSRPLRVYADSPVFGGCFDEEFAVASNVFFEQVREGRLLAVTSALVAEEIAGAPESVRDLFDELLPSMELAVATPAALALRQAYIAAGVVPVTSGADAFHVALATVAACEGIVSWNFRHIVHHRKIPMYNAVNVLKGHGALFIHSPQEVIDYDDGEEGQDL